MTALTRHSTTNERPDLQRTLARARLGSRRFLALPSPQFRNGDDSTVARPTNGGTGLGTGAALADSAVCRQRLRGPDLRNRLVSDVATCDRVVGHFARCAARNIYGGDVPGEHIAAALDRSPSESFARLCHT